MLSRLDSFVLQTSEKIQAILKILAYINSVFAFIFLLYRYGFYLSDQEVADVMFRFDIQFIAYILIFVLRILFSFDRLEYIKGHRLETFLNVSILMHGLVNYFFDFKFLLFLAQKVGSTYPELTYQHYTSSFLAFFIGLVVTEASTKISDLRIKPATTFIISFVILILGGTGLLMLPTMTVGTHSMPFIDALFTSTSASCVTGLIVVDTGTYFTMKGKIIIVLLIQLGGLGIISFATFFATFLSKGVGIKHQAIIQDFLSSESLSGAKGMLRDIVFITLLIEALGAVAVFFSWDEEFGEYKMFSSLGDKIFHSVFHSVSAFCNAGFSTFTDGLYNNDSEKQIRKMYALHFVIAIIVIFGGLGFTTIKDIFNPESIRERMRHSWKKWKIGTKISFYYSMVLVALGTLAFMFFEIEQLRDRTIIEAFITSFFQSVVTRTAGFNTMDFGTLRLPTIILTMFLMFIGGCPGSTAGGIKVNTFVLVTLSSYANIRGQKNISLYKRNIPTDLVNKAFAILMFSVTYNVIAVFMLSITDPDKEAVKLLFEQISAFATVGLSMGITSGLSDWGKFIIVVSMFIGRVGTLTLALALSRSVKTNSFRYPDAHFMVG